MLPVNWQTSFERFVEVNFDQLPAARLIFEEDLKPERIIRDLSLLTKKDIVPGSTLLFFDEAQEAPKALQSLRYFYEEMPDLHIIAAELPS
ncbi:MAG: AAA family ATPase [Candidatus Babeliales bacterium]